MMGIKEAPYGVCFQCGKASHLGKKLLLPGLLDSMLYKLDMQDPHENVELGQNKVGLSLKFLLHRRRTFFRTQKKETDELCQYRQGSPSNFLLH